MWNFLKKRLASLATNAYLRITMKKQMTYTGFAMQNLQMFTPCMLFIRNRRSSPFLTVEIVVINNVSINIIKENKRFTSVGSVIVDLMSSLRLKNIIN
jgi:hypothetical protein